MQDLSDFGLDRMVITKSYPTDVEAARQLWLKLIASINEKYEAIVRPPASSTAVAMSKSPKSQQQIAELKRSYDAEIEPVMKELMKLEGFATVRMVLPR